MDRATATGVLRTEFRADRANGSRDILADRLTHKQTGWSQYSALVPGRSDKELIDIRRRPNITTLLMVVASQFTLHVVSYGPLRPNMTSSIKPEVHNTLQHCQRRTEPRPRGIYVQNFVKIGPAFPDICSRTDRHTQRQTDKLIVIFRSTTGAE